MPLPCTCSLNVHFIGLILKRSNVSCGNGCVFLAGVKDAINEINKIILFSARRITCVKNCFYLQTCQSNYIVYTNAFKCSAILMTTGTRPQILQQIQLPRFDMSQCQHVYYSSNYFFFSPINLIALICIS